MFQIKICGVTRSSDARLAAEAGADAVGLNFYRKSPRYVEIDRAAQIVAALPDGVAKVGVFVDADAETVRTMFDRLRLDAIQLHGDQRPEFHAELGDRPVIRAFRCRAAGLDSVREYLDRCRRLGTPLQSVLIDAYQLGKYGGTGKLVDWGAVAAARTILGNVHLTLAGGLTPSNVAAAIRAAMPDAVDTASGVESSPGVKDVGLVRAFVAAAREAILTERG